MTTSLAYHTPFNHLSPVILPISRIICLFYPVSCNNFKLHVSSIQPNAFIRFKFCQSLPRDNFSACIQVHYVIVLTLDLALPFDNVLLHPVNMVPFFDFHISTFYRPGHYSRMSFSSDQVTGTVFPHLNMPFLPNSKFI